MANQITKMATKTAKQIIIIIFFCEKREKKWIDYWIVAFFHGNTWTPTHTDVSWKNMGRLCVCVRFGGEKRFSHLCWRTSHKQVYREQSFDVFHVKGTLGTSVREDTSTIHHTTAQVMEESASGTSSLGPFLMGKNFVVFVTSKHTA